MRRVRNIRAGAGFTLLELTLSVALLALVATKVHGALHTAQKSYDENARRTELEGQARQVMRQIAFAILGANRETLIPDASQPLSSSDMRFQIHLGIQDGAVVWSDPEQIAMNHDSQALFWSKNPGTMDEQRVIWSTLVTPFLEGELPNGIDDNGNGLIDERGLSFVVDRNAVTIRLTLERSGEGDDIIAETVETTVTCRNLERKLERNPEGNP